MSDEPQPEAVWYFPEKKSNKGRIWLIVGLVVAAIVIVAVVLFFLIPRGADPQPTSSPSSSASPTPSPSPSDSTDPAPDPSMTPITTPPPVPEPDLETFTAEVKPRLDDAVRGLDLVADNREVGAQIVETLQQDAEILASAAAPQSIASDWSDAVVSYANTLNELRSVLDAGSDPRNALDTSRASLGELRALAGL
ncbi:hypothetical protein [Microbacterium sp.]|uniref:hypothetical protein n=1 Tax=Microbacterium sp. TaxID=51671 RepID=UPI002619923C|nr:hypothetical protein [Microbacterium sp.]